MSKITSADIILNHWCIHRKTLIELVNLFPDSSTHWKPNDKVMNTVELIHHTAWTPNFFIASIENQEYKKPPVPTTLYEARQLLENLTTEQKSLISKYNETDFKKEATINRFNKTETVESILHRLIEHEVHHKGQIMLYARILGLEPPFYTIY